MLIWPGGRFLSFQNIYRLGKMRRKFNQIVVTASNKDNKHDLYGDIVLQLQTRIENRCCLVANLNYFSLFYLCIFHYTISLSPSDLRNFVHFFVSCRDREGKRRAVISLKLLSVSAELSLLLAKWLFCYHLAPTGSVCFM